MDLFLHTHFSGTTILILACLLILAGLYVSKTIDIISALVFACIVIGFYALRNHLPPTLYGVIFISMMITMMVFGISRMPGGITWFRFILLLLSLLAIGVFYYIDLLPHFLLIISIIGGLVYVLFFWAHKRR